MALLIAGHPNTVKLTGIGSPAAEVDRNNQCVLEFDASTIEETRWSEFMPGAYAQGGLTVIIEWIALSDTSGDVLWGVAFERHGPSDDLDDDDFATEKTAVGTAPATAGVTQQTSITFSDAEIDGIQAGEHFRIRIRRVASDSSDTMTNEAQLVGWQITQTAPAFRGVKLNSNADQSIGTGSQTDITFGSGTTVYDTDGFHDESVNNERITIPASLQGMKVRCNAGIRWQTSSAGVRNIDLQRYNSSDVLQESVSKTIPGAAGLEIVMCISGVFQVDAGDYFKVRGLQDSGGNLNAIGTVGTGQTHLAMEVIDPGLGDPVQGFLGCRATLSSNQSIAVSGTQTAIAFTEAEEDYDDGGWHSNTNSTRFTAPNAAVGKIVRATGNVRFASGAGTFRSVLIMWYDSGDVAKGRADSNKDPISGLVTLSNVAATFGPIESGDYFTLEVIQNSGGALDVQSAGLDTWFALDVIDDGLPVLPKPAYDPLGLYRYKDPSEAGAFSWVNQGTASIFEGAGGHLMQVPNSGSNNLRLREKTAPSEPWTIEAAFQISGALADFVQCGLQIRDSGTGRIENFVIGYNSGEGGLRYLRQHWTSPTAFSTQATSVPATYDDFPYIIWMRITNNATNIIWEISYDNGISWDQISSSGKNNWCASITDVGWHGNVSNGPESFFNLLSWEEK